MQDRPVKSFNNRTFRQFILNERQDDIGAVATQAQLGLLAALFYESIHELSNLMKETFFPFLALFSFIKQIRAFQYLKESKNRTAHLWINNLFTTLLLAAQTVGVVFFVISFAAAPFILAISAVTKTAKHFLEVMYHGYKLFAHWRQKKTYTQEYAYQKNEFKKSLKKFFIAAIAAAGIITLLFIPAVFPAIILLPSIILGIKAAVCGTLGFFCAYGLLKFSYQKIKAKKQPEQNAISNNLSNDEAQDNQQLIKDPSSNYTITTKLSLGDEIIEKYQDIKASDFNLAKDHLDDLIIKMESLDSQERKEFLRNLIKQEENRITNQNSIKYQAFSQLRHLVEDRSSHLNLEIDGKTYKNNIIGLVTYYKDEGKLNEIFSSPLAKHDMGALQKLFILTDCYFRLRERNDPRRKSQRYTLEEGKSPSEKNQSPISSIDDSRFPPKLTFHRIKKSQSESEANNPLNSFNLLAQLGGGVDTRYFPSYPYEAKEEGSIHSAQTTDTYRTDATMP